MTTPNPSTPAYAAVAAAIDPVGDGTDPSGRMIAINAAITALQSAVAAAQAVLATLGSAATHASTDFDAAGAASAVAGNLATHAAATAAHGATGEVVGISNAQTLTNKTISGSSNTITDIAQASITGLTDALAGKLSSGGDIAMDGHDVTGVGGISFFNSSFQDTAFQQNGDYSSAGLTSQFAGTAKYAGIGGQIYYANNDPVTDGSNNLNLASGGQFNLDADSSMKGDGAGNVSLSATSLAFAGPISTNSVAAHQLSVTAQTLTDGASIAWNMASGGNAKVTLGGNRTLANPTNLIAGATYTLIVIQDSTGSRTLSYGSAYKFPGGIKPVLSLAASAGDMLSFYSPDGATLWGVAQKAFA